MLATCTHLKAVRLAVLAIWLGILLSTHYESYALLPDDMVQGVGVGRVFLRSDGVRETLFSVHALSLLRWGTSVAIVLAFFRPVKLLLLVICANVLVLDQLTKAISAYPNHAQFNALAALFVIAVLSSPDLERSTVVGATNARREAIMWLLGVLLVLPYTFIGVNRLLEGGLAIFVGDALPGYLAYTREIYSVYSFGLPETLAALPTVKALVKASFMVATAFEIMSPAILAFPRWRAVWLLFMCCFHLATLFLMNIFFWEQLILIVIVFGWGLPEDVRRVLNERRYRRQRSFEVVAEPVRDRQ